MSKLSSNFDAIEGWVVVYNSNSEMDASLMQAYLNDANIETQIYSQRDHMLPANAFDQALVHLLVPKTQEKEAKELVDAFLNQDSKDDPSKGI